MMHIGCVLILAGGLWGSRTSQELQKKLFDGDSIGKGVIKKFFDGDSIAKGVIKKYLGRDKITKGRMLIYEGQTDNTILKVVDEKYVKAGELDFSIRLDDFRMEYYAQENLEPPTVHISSTSGGHWDLEAAVGKQVDLGPAGKMKVLRKFKRFRLGDGSGIDAKSGPSNPAVEVELVKADGTSVKKYVYAHFPDFTRDIEGLKLVYEIPRVGGMVKDYFSDLVVIKDGDEVLKKTIEVNDPLYYGGYHFYQSDYDHKNGRYTVLSVTSDTGLYAVFTGFFLLCLGVIWQFWGRIRFDSSTASKVEGGQA